MKKLSFYGSMLVIALLLGITITLFLPGKANALPPCTPCPPYRVLVGDCTFKCQPGYIGYKYAIYAGYYFISDPIIGDIWGPCNFQNYYCECVKDYVPHEEPTPEF